MHASLRKASSIKARTCAVQAQFISTGPVEAKMQISTVTVLIAALYGSAKAFENVSDSSTGLVCPSTHFSCQNAYRCIEKDHLCNGQNNCGDNSDEDLTACILNGKVSAHLTCKADEFQCKNGFRCVPAGYLCDNDNDCRDNSDEDPNECIRAGLYDDHVTCAYIGFICGGGTGACISRKLLCNGKNDCGDNTDEDVTNCRAEGVVEDELSCKDREFRCKNEFKCVPKTFLCDHDNDCLDGSDEDPVECAKEGFVPEGTTCGDLGFECRNTTFGGSFCIGNLFICDGNNNCGDNSDENPEICEHRSDKPTLEILPWYERPDPNSKVVKLCGNDQFRCGPSCKSKRFLCHPNVDNCNAETSSVCLNRTQSHKCMSHQVKCKNNKCVYKGHVCDGDDDCGDMSDEDPTKCSSVVRTTTTTAASIYQSSGKRPLICKRDQFKCLDGSKCIRNATVCDRERHCADGSDETQEACIAMGVTVRVAPSTATPGRSASCVTGQFQCNNKRCILASYVCDGDNDCQDYTDESPPYCNPSSTRPGGPETTIPPRPISCLDGQFRCSTNSPTPTCISRSQVCDGTRNCPQGDDEQSNLCQASSSPTSTTTRRPTVLSCAADEFLCAEGRKCIPIAFVCDGSPDCDHGSDEDTTRCFSSSSQKPVDSKPGGHTVKSADDGHVELYVITFSAAALVLISVVVFIVIKKYRSNPRRGY